MAALLMPPSLQHAEHAAVQQQQGPGQYTTLKESASTTGQQGIVYKQHGVAVTLAVPWTPA